MSLIKQAIARNDNHIKLTFTGQIGKPLTYTFPSLGHHSPQVTARIIDSDSNSALASLT